MCHSIARCSLLTVWIASNLERITFCPCHMIPIAAWPLVLLTAVVHLYRAKLPYFVQAGRNYEHIFRGL